MNFSEIFQNSEYTGHMWITLSKCCSFVFIVDYEHELFSIFKLTFTSSKSKIEVPDQMWNPLKLTIKTLEWSQWRRSGVFIVNFKHISHIILVFLLMNLNKQIPTG